MADDITKKIEHLLARATDPGATEEERRTSGVLAAELMKKHGLAPTRAATPPAPAPPPTKPVTSTNKWQDFRENFERQHREKEAAKSPEQRAREKAEADWAKMQQNLTIAAFNFGTALGNKHRK